MTYGIIIRNGFNRKSCSGDRSGQEYYAACLQRPLALAGAKVAVLDLNEEVAGKVADDIVATGHTAKAYKANVLERESLEEVHARVLAELGPCDILVNGAGGNNPKAQTTKGVFRDG